MNADTFTADGTVEQDCPGRFFRVVLDNGYHVLGYLSGKLWKARVKILPGDRVRCELSPYDLSKVRIVWRYLRD